MDSGNMGMFFTMYLYEWKWKSREHKMSLHDYFYMKIIFLSIQANSFMMCNHYY